MNASLMKKPSAFFPVAMSVACLALVVNHLAIHGPAPQADEGAAAHLFQILMALQVPIIGYFALRWLPQAPRQALWVLALQFATALAALFPVWWLRW